MGASSKITLNYLTNGNQNGRSNTGDGVNRNGNGGRNNGNGVNGTPETEPMETKMEEETEAMELMVMEAEAATTETE